MKKHHWLLAFVVVAAYILGPGSSTQGQKIRPPAVAGTFYPADPKELGKMVDGFLAAAQVPEISEPLVALVAPHAGYVYSGPIAAHSYALLKGRKIERVVVIAPSHYEAFDFTSVFDGDAYETPLGRVQVDRTFAAKLAGMKSSIKLSSRGHLPAKPQGEHALEVQLPFLQRVLGTFTLVPVIMGDQSYEASRDLGVALAKLIHGPETLIVASSDLSHYYPYDNAVALDRKTLTALQEYDYLSMSWNFQRRVWEACGGAPIVAAMIAAERLGANDARLIKYANSGDTAGDRSRVVGYGSAVMLKQAGQRAESAPFVLGSREKTELMTIARKSVETTVKEHKQYECSAGGMDALLQDRAAFVTLKENGQLRGCIGYSIPTKSLCHTVRDVAAEAAVRDPRFRPVSTAELGRLQYEITVLSPLRRVTDIKQIQIGKHGLLIKRGSNVGVFLPQVPAEQGWDRTAYLEHLCEKAGLPIHAWMDEETDIFSFTGLVFGEKDVAAKKAF